MSELRMNENELNEELSAFMDGELDADRTRFLQQRLSHDAELRARWERWQMLSSAMRRQGQPAPAGFAERVARAIDAEAAPAHARPMRGMRWIGGAALAASLVVAAAFVLHPGQKPPAAVAPIAAATHAPILPIQRTELPMPEPVVDLPIPVRSGVVTAFHSPLQPILVREQPQRPNFAPFPQPYAIDPELEAYLQSQKDGKPRDVLGQDPANSGAVRTVAWPQDQQH
jgi:anti-sigma factor RsiW